MKLYRAALVLAMVLPIGCSNTNVVVTPTQVGAPLPTVAPSIPTPRPVAGSTGTPAFASLRVGIYAGCAGIDNAQNKIRVGCTATLTATPKDAAGRDLEGISEETWRSAIVAWTVVGASCSDLNVVRENANQFNREVLGLTAGSCSVCATVWGVQGCARQPDGSSAVVVIS